MIQIWFIITSGSEKASQKVFPEEHDVSQSCKLWPSSDLGKQAKPLVPRCSAMFRHPTEVTCPDFRKIKSWFVLLVLPVLAPLPTLLRFTSSWQPMLDRRCLAAGALARYAFSDWLPATSFPQSCRVHNGRHFFLEYKTLNSGVNGADF